LLITFIVIYRERPGRRAFYSHGNSGMALGLTLALSLLVFVGIDVNLAYHDHHAFRELLKRLPEDHEALRVDVLAEAFAWNIRYPGEDGQFGRVDAETISYDNPFGLDYDDPASEDDIVTVNQLAIPVNQEVELTMRSKDVIHSFFLPNFRIKQDVVPGLQTRMHFTAVKTGLFEIACAELCGLGHYRMRGEVHAMEPEEFEAWLESQKEAEFFDEEFDDF
jgi:cytochrome c oxidase subunit 2